MTHIGSHQPLSFFGAWCSCDGRQGGQDVDISVSDLIRQKTKPEGDKLEMDTEQIDGRRHSPGRQGRGRDRHKSKIRKNMDQGHSQESKHEHEARVTQN